MIQYLKYDGMSEAEIIVERRFPRRSWHNAWQWVRLYDTIYIRVYVVSCYSLFCTSLVPFFKTITKT